MKRPTTGVREEYVPGISKTDQSFKNEVNVNTIMDKWRKGQQITHLSRRQGQFMDASNIPDLHKAFAQVEQAREAFAQLPARIRDAMGNDPRNIEAFLLDEEARPLLEEYGLLKERTDETPSSVTTKVAPAKPAVKPKKTEAPPEPVEDEE